MPKRRDIIGILLIVLPWTLLITVWHHSAITPLLATRKDDRRDGRSNSRNTFAFKESCSLQNRDIVEVERTEYVYSRPPPWSDILPTIHVISPTYSRPVQKAELTRLANTLLHVPNLHWILVEDSKRRSTLVSSLLQETRLNYTHLNVETPRNYKMRSTKKVSVWPVAFVGGLRYESPKVNTLGKVYGWKTVFDPHRPFAIDMAGFAVNLHLILSKPRAYFKLHGVKGGYQESSLLKELVTLSDLEPKAANCTKVLVWHTRTEKPVLVNEGKKGFTDSNVEI
ncbi:galactosylgalactosylxylosylprotein 3-beta-glucuronosyltransferase 1-like isoform X2 [Cottoperca gobio]|uniref:Galactosylgalactosylxylosylprotein 3-beta-glucuronosyltransferase n=1 Tax=Cottoperca gobio TaxID=56716 RepID=A0A6J2R340_COTGO|nr:galactosylgalactosylxylosylprotein 3-beta-glucuronosyltransferase 1-like isoform X2 [Cottoperca gobio]